MPPVAVIKVGSTSSTLLVAESLHRPVTRQQQLLDLYREANAPVLGALLQRWTAECRALGAPCLAAGGEAVRQNPRYQGVIGESLSAWLPLSGEREGRLTMLAVQAEMPDVDVVVDIGGGSTEVVTLRTSQSFAIGAAHPAPAIVLPRVSGSRPVFVGGTAVALRRWRGRAELDCADIIGLLDEVHKPSALTFLDPLRRQLLPQGLGLMKVLLDANGWDRFRVSERGLTEGLWMVASLGRVSRP